MLLLLAAIAGGLIAGCGDDESSPDETPSPAPTGTPFGAQSLAFVSGDAGQSEIQTVNEYGSGLAALSAAGAYENSFGSWSPDGRRIAFNSTRDGASDIFVMNADGSDQRRITFESSSDGFTAWSPDGGKSVV